MVSLFYRIQCNLFRVSISLHGIRVSISLSLYYQQCYEWPFLLPLFNTCLSSLCEFLQRVSFVNMTIFLVISEKLPISLVSSQVSFPCSYQPKICEYLLPTFLLPRDIFFHSHFCLCAWMIWWPCFNSSAHNFHACNFGTACNFDGY